jgi:hypothetical protein
VFKRIATFLLGVGLIGLGVLFFVAPERAYLTQLLIQFWPLFLILAGLVRVAGYLIDRHPHSPVGGMMISAIGGILLAANLRGENSFIQLIGNYWFWLLLAYIIGRVLRQYTYRHSDGRRLRAFSPGAIAMMMLIVGSGLMANYLSKNNHYLNRIDLPLGKFGDLSNYVLGSELTIEDEPPQTFALLSNSRLIINGSTGDIEIAVAPQTQASTRIVKRIRVANEEEAKKVAQNVHLQVLPDGDNFQISVNAPGIQQNFYTSIIITLPAGVQTGIEVSNAMGPVKISGLRGDHTIRNCEQVVVNDNTGRVIIENPRGSLELNRIRGEVSLVNIRQDVELRDVAGAIALDVKGGNVSIEQVSGPVRAQIVDAQVELNAVGNKRSEGLTQNLVNLDDVRNSRISLQEIKGDVTISAERTRINAEGIDGDFNVKTSYERVIANRIDGSLRIKADDGMVEIEDMNGTATVEATRDITVQNFRGPLNITSRLGKINLSTDERIVAAVKAVNETGRIRVSLPRDSEFRLDAASNYGRVQVRGFEQITLPHSERSAVTGYNVSDSAPLISLRSNNGNIRVQSSGLALASREEE